MKNKILFSSLIAVSLALLPHVISADSSSDPATTVAGVRGLESSDQEIDTKVRDYPAIDRLDKVHIKDDDLAQFKREGGLK
jgi:hypothetical protein